MMHYPNFKKEKKKLKDYYTEAYGDSEFAKALTNKYDTRTKGKAGPANSKNPKGAPSDVNKMKKMVHK